MAKNPFFKPQFRRRREQKTDYNARLHMLEGGKPRVVVRRSLNNYTVQIVQYAPDGDRTLASSHGSELAKYGWLGHCGNLPAAYLTGLLCGTRAKGIVKEAIMDIGLHTSTKGVGLYAALKGVVDAKIEVPHNPDVLPPQERIRGDHIAAYAKKLRESSPQQYKKRFSAYLAQKLAPEQLAEHFETVKGNIETNATTEKSKKPKAANATKAA